MAPRRRSWVRVVQFGLGLALVIVTFAVFLPKVADYGSVWAEARSMSWPQLVLLLAVAVWNVLTFGPNWMVALPGLRYRQSLEVTMAGTAVANVVPAGSAVSFGVTWAMLREWGFKRPAVARALVINGVWNHLTNVGYPLVALLLLTLTGGKDENLTRASIVGAILFGLSVGFLVAILHSERQAYRFGALWDRVATWIARIFRRGPVKGSGAALANFRLDSLDLLRRRWLALTVAIIVGTLSVFLVMFVALRVTGVPRTDVSLVEAFTAWSLIRLLTAIPLTPGGVGITELGLVGTLTGFGGSNPKVVAAVLLYRALTYLPPVLLGALVAFTWRRQKHTPKALGL